jgi:hypothetical protein
MTDIGRGEYRTNEAGEGYLSLDIELHGKRWKLLVLRDKTVEGRVYRVIEQPDEFATRQGHSIDGRRQWVEDNSEAPF